MGSEAHRSGAGRYDRADDWCLLAADLCRAGLAAVLVLVIRPKVMRKR